MTNFDITTQSQGIYPDGFNQSVIISNNGPATLYLDENSSISELSYAVPVLGTIVWDARRPLWMKSKGLSHVNITRNGNLQVNTADRFFVLYYNPLYDDGSTPGGTITWTSRVGDALEVAAFKTVVVQFLEEFSDALAPSFAETFMLTAYWYDEKGLLLSHQTFEGFRANSNSSAQDARVAIPVRAFAVKFDITDFSSVATRKFGLKVTGITTSEPFSWESMRGACIYSGAVGTVNEGYGTWFESLYPFTDRYLNGLSRLLRVHARINTVATTAATEILIADSNLVQAGRISIPAGTAAGTTFTSDFRIPNTIPLKLSCNAPGGTPSLGLAITFVDLENQ